MIDFPHLSGHVANMRPLPSHSQRPPTTRCDGDSEPGATEQRYGHSANHAKGESRRRNEPLESGRIPGNVPLRRRRPRSRHHKTSQVRFSHNGFMDRAAPPRPTRGGIARFRATPWFRPWCSGPGGVAHPLAQSSLQPSGVHLARHLSRRPNTL